MDDDPPLCGNCGHRLSGLIESSNCPERGRSLVEILTLFASGALSQHPYLAAV